MNEMDNPRFKKKTDNAKVTFQRLGSSFTEEEISELSKSGYSSEKSFYESYKVYSPKFRPIHKSTDFTPYEQFSITPITNESQTKEIFMNQMEEIRDNLFGEIEKFKLQIKLLNNENIQLKAKNQDLEKQIDSINDKLQKKEKEINKCIFDKDIHLKAEEDIRKLLEESRKRYESIIKENNDMKHALENSKIEKKESLKELRESENLIEKMQKTLKFKEDLIKDLNQTIVNLEKDLISSTKPNIKSQTNKFNIKRLDIPEKRGISDSPEHKHFHFSDRSEENIIKNIWSEALKSLNVSSAKEFFEKIVYLKQSQLKYKKFKKLIDKISDMIVQCSPTGSFSREPSNHQIWKWLTRLLEEYMKLKQSVSGESFNKLCQALNTDSIEEMLEKVAHLQNSRSRGVLRNP